MAQRPASFTEFAHLAIGDAALLNGPLERIWLCARYNALLAVDNVIAEWAGYSGASMSTFVGSIKALDPEQARHRRLNPGHMSALMFINELNDAVNAGRPVSCGPAGDVERADIPSADINIMYPADAVTSMTKVQVLTLVSLSLLRDVLRCAKSESAKKTRAILLAVEHAAGLYATYLDIQREEAMVAWLTGPR